MIVMHRLPSDSDEDVLQKSWPRDCPEDFQEFEMRIDLPRGCPPSLIASIAAHLHGWGRCTHAWLKGAVVTRNKKQYRVELVENIKPFEFYIKISVRIQSKELGTDEISLLKGMAKLMQKEREDRLPGIDFNIQFPCPDPSCCRPTIEWNLQEDKPYDDFCSLCGRSGISYDDMIIFTDKHITSTSIAEENNLHETGETDLSSPTSSLIDITKPPLPNDLEAAITKCFSANKHLTRRVLMDVIVAVAKTATEGTGENTPAKGMLLIIGDAEKVLSDLRENGKPKFGELLVAIGDISTYNFCVRDFLKKDETKRVFWAACKEDGGIVIDGKSGKLHAYSFRVSDLGEAASGVGGTKSTAASSIAMQAGGCVSITVSEDDCTTADKPRMDPTMKLFLCTQQPVKVKLDLLQKHRM